MKVKENTKKRVNQSKGAIWGIEKYHTI